MIYFQKKSKKSKINIKTKKAQTLELCSLVLNTIRNIYNKDHCNYFLLESQNVLLYSMDETSIKIHIRNNDIQVRYYFYDKIF